MPIIGNLSSAGKKPTTPTIGTATDGGTGTTVSVAFTPSTYIGKGTITYTALSSPGSLTGTGSGSPITVSGLTTGTAYTFTVKGDTNYGVASDYSAASNSVTPASPSSFESIATINPTSGSSITFSSIPSGYKSLQIRFLSLDDGNDDLGVRFNGATGSAYSWHRVRGYNAGVAATGGANATYMVGGRSSNTASTGNAGIIDIIDYTLTSKDKTIRSFYGNDINNNFGYIALSSGDWRSTAAVTSITIFGINGYAFAAGSKFALYGIK